MLNRNNFRCTCAVHVNAAFAVTGRGAATPAAHPGAGRVQITLEEPLNAAQAFYRVIRRSGTIAAGNLNTTYNVLDVSDTVKEVESLVEGALGGASAMTDTTFDFFAFKVE